MSMNEITETTGLSKGSVSTGLRLLERMKSVHSVIIPKDRRTYYKPELSLRKLVAGLLEENVNPTLEQGHLTLEAAAQVSSISPHMASRLSSLQHWNQTARGLIPVLGLLE